MPVEVARQIELDVPRTFCDQRDFLAAAAAVEAAAAAAVAEAAGAGAETAATPSGGSRSATMDAATSAAVVATLTRVGEGTIYDALRRMLRAFCVYHPRDEYLQSMNFVAAFLLLVFGREEEARAFWGFEWLVGHALHGYYTPSMGALTGDCALFRDLLAARRPPLAAHLERVGGLDIASLFAPRWLLCLYLNVFPADIVVRVWDAVLMAGRQAPRVLVEVALAVTAMCETALLECRSFVDAAEVLKHMGSHVTDSAELLLLTTTPTCSLAGAPMEAWRTGGAQLLAAPAPPAAAVAAASPPPVPLVAGVKRSRGGGGLPLCSPLSPAAACAGGGVLTSPAAVASAAAVAAGAAGQCATPPVAGERRGRLSIASPGRTPPVSFDAPLPSFAAMAAGAGGAGSPSVVRRLGIPVSSPLAPPAAAVVSPRASLVSPRAAAVNAARRLLSPSKLASPPPPAGIAAAATAAAAAAATATGGVPPTPAPPLPSHAPARTPAASTWIPTPGRVRPPTATLPPGPPSALCAAMGAALNPATAVGAASARKRRELMRLASASGAAGVVGVSSSVRKPGRPASAMASPPPRPPAPGGRGTCASRRYATQYDEYDDDAADPGDNSEQLMSFAPPSSKRPRGPDAAPAPRPTPGLPVHPLAPVVSAANPPCGADGGSAPTPDATSRPLSLQLQLLSPPRSTQRPHALAASHL